MAKFGDGLTGRIRAAAVELGMNGKEFTVKDLGDRVGIQTFADNKRLHWMLKDLRKRGELINTGRGIYRRALRKDKESPPHKNEVMWRFLRMNRTVTVEDLREVAGVTANYAREWIRLLMKREIVRAIGTGKYQLVKDSLENPKDVEKAERLRALRGRQKEQMLAHMKAARSLVNTVELCAIDIWGLLREIESLVDASGVYAEVGE
jgi:hypothetical protein